ncbi:MAG: ribosome rescue GTPase HflX [Pseudomonadota bacterium]
MFERPGGGERAVLVYVALGQPPEDDEIAEFVDLVSSAGADPIDVITTSRASPDPHTFIGSGKLEEIKQLLDAEAGELVIFDNQLSPAQERNIERHLSARVLDRTGLILDIFAQRAQSFEGKLQVELAQLRHLSTRLVRGWTHLERQKGGIGLRGPGETQLETDRRLIAQRITRIRKRLHRVDSQRELGRKARRRADIPTASLVGYTNAGKSTLFNLLTSADVYAQDQLFATLDPTLRKLMLPGNTPVVLADTVGFISRLPHELVAAFRSTLQESIDATLLLHVIDASNPARDEQVVEVQKVLQQIGADKVPQLEIYNKIDELEKATPRIDRDEAGRPQRVWISAQQNAGIELLLQVLKELLGADQVQGQLTLDATQGELRAALYREGSIQQEQPTGEGGWKMDVSLPIRSYKRLLKTWPVLQVIQRSCGDSG